MSDPTQNDQITFLIAENNSLKERITEIEKLCEKFKIKFNEITEFLSEIEDDLYELESKESDESESDESDKSESNESESHDQDVSEYGNASKVRFVKPQV